MALGLVLEAFLFSLLASLALPFGAIIGVTFAPVSENLVALLMSFGAGALLFAVTIEMYGDQLHSLNSHPSHMNSEQQSKRFTLFLYIKIIISLGACGVGGWLYLLFNRFLKNLINSAEMQPMSRRTTLDSGYPTRDTMLVHAQAVGPPATMLTPPRSPRSSNVDGGMDGPGGMDGATTDEKHKYRKLEVQAPTVPAISGMIGARVSGRDEHAALQRPSTDFDPFRASTNLLRPTSYKRNCSAFLNSHSDFQERRKPRATALQMVLAQAIDEDETEAEFEDYGTLTLSPTQSLEQASSEAPLIKDDERKRNDNVAKKMSVKRGKTQDLFSAQQGAKKKALAFSIIAGVIVDGVAEGGLIAFLAVHRNLSADFIFSVFLANFPEAFSSASMLRSVYRGKNGNMHSTLIVLSWFMMSLTTATLSAGVAFCLVSVEDINSLGMQIASGFMEGLAAGAMLMMLLSVMVPEAFEVAHDISSIMMILGFVVSITGTVVFGYVDDFGSNGTPKREQSHFLPRKIS